MDTHTLRFSRARLLLRKKKHQETLLERTDKQLDNLEQLVYDIESADVQRKVLDGLKSGSEVSTSLTWDHRIQKCIRSPLAY